MSASLLVVIKDGNGYTGSSGVVSITSQVIKFNYKRCAEEAMHEILRTYEGSSMKIKVTLLEDTA